MLEYSASALDTHHHLKDYLQEFFPSAYVTGSITDPSGDDKKVTQKRAKSPYRDAHFRQWFQALADIETLEREASTMVIESVTPTSPTPSTASTDERRLERFWKRYRVPTPGLPQHSTPAVWRDLSDIARLEWFHHAVAVLGLVRAFTLNLSADVEATAREQRSAVKWLSHRLARRLKEALGRDVPFWFTLEMTDIGIPRRLHLHGELQIAPGERKAARLAMRLAAGKWEHARRHQVHTRANPTTPWSTTAASATRSCGLLQAGWRACSTDLSPVTGSSPPTTCVPSPGSFTAIGGRKC